MSPSGTPTRSSPATGCAPPGWTRRCWSTPTAGSTRCCRGTARWPIGWSPGGSPTPSRWTGCVRPSTRWPRISVTGPTSCSDCPMGSTSTSNWSPTNRGRGSTTTWAGSAAGWPSTPTCRCSPRAWPTWWPTRPTPGHHTEHTRKEVGLVRRRQWWEESIFLVGTPQCLLAEGLADLGLEVVMGRRPEASVADHLRPLGIRYDAEVVAAVAEAGEALGRGAPERRLPAARGRRRSRHGQRRGGPLGAALAGPGGQGRRVPDPSHLAGVPDLLRRGPSAVPRLRGRGPGPFRPPALRAADPGRVERADPGRPRRSGRPGPMPAPSGREPTPGRRGPDPRCPTSTIPTPPAATARTVAVRR